MVKYHSISATVNLPDNEEIADLPFDNQSVETVMDLLNQAYPKWESLVIVISRGQSHE